MILLLENEAKSGKIEFGKIFKSVEMILNKLKSEHSDEFAAIAESPLSIFQ